MAGPQHSITGKTDLFGGPEPGIGASGRSFLESISLNKVISGEEHALDLVVAGTLSSGEGLVGINVAVTPAGSAASWVSALYGKVVQTGTKAVTGYLCAAELEVVLGGTYNPSDWAVLVLNATDNNANPANTTHRSYVMVRDYGSSKATALFCFMDEDVASLHDSGRMVVESTAIPAVTDDNWVMVRCLVGTTPIWLVSTKTAPS